MLSSMIYVMPLPQNEGRLPCKVVMPGWLSDGPTGEVHGAVLTSQESMYHSYTRPIRLGAFALQSGHVPKA